MKEELEETPEQILFEQMFEATMRKRDSKKEKPVSIKEIRQNIIEQTDMKSLLDKL